MQMRGALPSQQEGELPVQMQTLGIDLTQVDTRAASLRGSRKEGKTAAGEAKDLQSWEGQGWWYCVGKMEVGRRAEKQRFLEERKTSDPDGGPKPEVGQEFGA